MLLSSTEITTASVQTHVHMLALALLQCPADCPEQNGTYIGTQCSLQRDTACHRVPARTQQGGTERMKRYLAALLVVLGSGGRRGSTGRRERVCR